MKSLDIDPPDVLTRVTEYVEEIKEYIKQIMKNNYAYKSESGSVYFNIG